MSADYPDGDQFVVRKAARRACPQIIAIAGPTGSGKTYSALLVAAGLAGPNGKVGFVDTENGRGATYADDPGIMKALPGGYLIVDVPSPWTPERYISGISAIEQAGCNVCVIDSGSHEWEGEGGCSDIAEKDKGRWNNAKRRHKKFMSRLLYSNMHIIVCLRAREKSKIVPKTATTKEEVISLGVLPICEKNFMYEMLLSLQIDNDHDHIARPIKIPGLLRPIFSTPHVLTVADGEAIARWNNTGAAFDEDGRLAQRARAAAESGMAEYEAFWKSITAQQRKAIQDHHAELKRIAESADAAARAGDIEELEGFLDALGADQFYGVLGRLGVAKIDEATAVQRARAIEEMRGLVG